MPLLLEHKPALTEEDDMPMNDPAPIIGEDGVIQHAFVTCR
jgi:hypothetical protein